MEHPSTRWGLGVRIGRPSLGTAVGLILVGLGVLIGLRSLSDNSFLTHLATGRLILDRGRVPSTDPYTFTAHGEPWVVQSWLVSVVYASAERLGGLGAVRVVVAGLFGLLTAVGWQLLRPAEALILRLAAAAIFVVVGAGEWAERPLMFGLTAFGLTLLAAEGRFDPRWLVPIGWLWVNCHGSFPLGIVYLATAIVGRRLDGVDGSLELRCLRWSCLGMALGSVGPLGPRVLIFPVELLSKQDVLRTVIEWQAPAFDDLSQRMFLLQLVATIALLARRPSYRSTLVVAVFSGAALLGSRNLAVASLALLPVMAPSLRGMGSLTSSQRTASARWLAITGAVSMLLLVGARMGEPVLTLQRYPVRAVAFLEGSEVDLNAHRLAAPDFVGNLVEYVYGPGQRVFYDDRFDMFPDEVSAANLAFIRTSPGAGSELARLEIELVTFPRSSSVARVFTVDPAWRVLYTDDRWMLACRRGVALGAVLEEC